MSPRPTSGAAPESVADVRRARREFVRTTHPDRGGDPDRFRVGLAELDHRLRVLAEPERLVRVVVVRRPRGVIGWLNALLMQVRSPRRPARVH